MGTARTRRRRRSDAFSEAFGEGVPQKSAGRWRSGEASDGEDMEKWTQFWRKAGWFDERMRGRASAWLRRRGW